MSRLLVRGKLLPPLLLLLLLPRHRHRHRHHLPPLPLTVTNILPNTTMWTTMMMMTMTMTMTMMIRLGYASVAQDIISTTITLATVEMMVYFLLPSEVGVGPTLSTPTDVCPRQLLGVVGVGYIVTREWWYVIQDGGAGRLFITHKYSCHIIMSYHIYNA